MAFLSLLLAAAAAAASAQMIPATEPLSYVASMLQPGETITVDGNLNDPAWQLVPWTSDFGDISGPTVFPQPWFATRVKMRWDATYLYIGAYVQETQIWANETQENSVIFNDNDFEVFIDPDSSTHYYKEFEINARNVSWHLTLTQPYINGGNPYNNSLPGLQTGVAIDGTLNNPSAGPSKDWTVEVALPLAAYIANTTARMPQDGDIWRINFSRVEYNVTVVNNTYVKTNPVCANWVWSPQDAIAMHLPERWGFLQFSSAAAPPPAFSGEPRWPLMLVGRTVYYYMAMFQAVNGYYTTDLTQLYGLPAFVMDGSLGTAPPVVFQPPASPWGYSCNVTFAPGAGGTAANITLQIRDDRLTTFSSSS